MIRVRLEPTAFSRYVRLLVRLRLLLASAFLLRIQTYWKAFHLFIVLFALKCTPVASKFKPAHNATCRNRYTHICLQA